MRIQSQIEELLRPAGRITDYGWNLVSTATTQGATLLAAVILTRLLTVESFGRYAIGQTTVTALSGVFSLGLGFVANALLARSSDAARQASIHRFCLTVVVVFGVTAGALVASGSIWLARHLFHDSSIQPILLIAGLIIPFGAVGSYQAGALAGTRVFNGLAAAAAAGGICLLVGVSIGASVAAASGALVGLGFAHVIRDLVSALVLRARVSGLRGAPDLSIGETWGKIRQFVLPTVLSAFTGMPAIWLATAVLTTHADTRAVGVFASAFLMKSLVTFVPLQFGSVLLSRLSMLSAKGDVAAWRRTHTLVLLAGVGIALLLALPLTLLSSQVMAIFGPDYRDGALLLRWLMLCAVFEAAATLTYYAFPSQGTFWKAALAYSLPKDVLLVVAAIPLVMRFEALGLALAHTMSWVYGLFALTLLSWSDRRRGAQASPLVPASFGERPRAR